MNSTRTYTKNIKNPKIRNQKKNLNNTLYVSGLRNNVRKKDLHRHFVGCTKITMKRHQMPPYLKYILIFL
jgi:RNA recognition motif-containing protein